MYGALLVNFGKTYFSESAPDLWLFLMAALFIGVTMAFIGIIVGEFITGAGLGGVIQVSRKQQRVDKIFAGLLLARLKRIPRGGEWIDENGYKLTIVDMEGRRIVDAAYRLFRRKGFTRVSMDDIATAAALRGAGTAWG